MADRSDEALLSKVTELAWREFEVFVAALWELQGWNTVVTPEGGDDGIDVKATHGVLDAEIELQAKNQSSKPIRSPDLQKYTVDGDSDALYAVVITTGSFTSNAEAFARPRYLICIDGNDLVDLIKHLDATDLLSEFLNTDDWDEIDFRNNSSLTSLASFSPSFPRFGETLPNEDTETIQTEDTDSRSTGSAENNEYGVAGQTSIEVIKGVGAKREQELVESGVETIGDLANSDPVTLAELNGISEGLVQKWRARVNYRLQTPVERIDGIGEQRESELQKAGISTVGELAIANPEEIANQVSMSEDFVETLRDRAALRPKQLVTEIDGIGPVTESELRDAGVETIADLNAADPELLSEQVSLSESHLRELIDKA